MGVPTYGFSLYAKPEVKDIASLHGKVVGIMSKGASSEHAVVERPPASVALPPETELWDIVHAAQFLKMSVSWVYKRVESGDLPD